MFALSFLFATLLTNAQEVVAALYNEQIGDRFSLTGVACNVAHGSMTFSDDSGCIRISNATNAFAGIDIREGSVVSISGHLGRNRINLGFAKWDQLCVITNATPPPAIPVRASDIVQGRAYGARMTISGRVRECFKDEIDHNCLFFVLISDGECIYVTLPNTSANRMLLATLVDCRVRVTGSCIPFLSEGFRQAMGPFISSSGDRIEILQRPASDPFSAPLLSIAELTTPSRISTAGRRRLFGIVLATWNGKHILLRDTKGRIHNVRLRTPSPPLGKWIETVGLPETDLFRINLTDAIWRFSSGEDLPPQQPKDTVLESILTFRNGQPLINPGYHGKLIRVSGCVMDMPNGESGKGTFSLRCGETTASVNVTANPDVLTSLSVGCSVAVTGICMIETEPWRHYTTIPHATSISLIPRFADDISILAQPPWWTPRRLTLVIITLILLSFGLFLWNRWLNRLICRRSRALVKEHLALAEAELKVGERTRLAVELHDSLSQNLAAVACQVAATKSAVKVNADETMDNLNTAERMLLSCRTELRRCLWDLRNDALDGTNMTDVIRKVLAPVLGNAALQTRFNVPRDLLDDSSLHAVICIIRELTSNAVTHGRATQIGIAGDLDGNNLAFSVRENGKGFDITTCNGPAEGHFGLAGIHERVERLNGTFTLKSHPGKGSYAKITFRLPTNDVED